MLIALGGIAFWLAGWWFTGRLFRVYRAAISLEVSQELRIGRVRASKQHHIGAILFALVDLAILIVGIRALARLRWAAGLSVPHSLTAYAVEWSILVSLYLIREGTYLHHFYLDWSRARRRGMRSDEGGRNTLQSLWDATPTHLRVLFFVAPLLAIVPSLTSLAGADTGRLFYVPGGSAGTFLVWFLLPQALLLLALVPPISRQRRDARLGLGNGA